MSLYRKLAGQTAIYGLSSIVGRVLNYFLTPLYTAAGIFSLNQYGVITEMYAYVAFLVVFLTYGMETAFFRFSSKTDNKSRVYSTAVLTLTISSTSFIILATLFAQPIANWLMYPDHKEYVTWFAIIVALDALTSIPLARLREEGRALKFALISFAGIAVNIGLNLFFLLYCMKVHGTADSNWLVDSVYNPEIGVGYVFIANLIASITRYALLLPDLLRIHFKLQWDLLKPMLKYAMPLLFAGLAGIVNETIDRIMLKRLLYTSVGAEEALTQVGIYGAFYKISIVISLFIQAFRYAAEPFFFAQDSEKNSKETYARVMTYFVIVCSVIFLGVMLFIDVFRYFILNPAYWESEGVKVVPILLFANICLGIYYNQSVWYKLTGQTKFGAFISIGGALITLFLNYLLIPIIGFMGSAWATLACYASMMIASYVLGQKHFPIPYRVPRIVGYLASSFALYQFSTQFIQLEGWAKFAVNGLLIVTYLGAIYLLERPKKVVP